MPTRGIKRKYPEWEESVLDGHLSFQTDSYSFFRQSLLNMSLEKFNKGRMMVEPSLRRYVLIANTLRVIQEDIRHESPCPVPATDGGVPVTCDPSTGNVVLSSLLPPDLENILLPSVEDDFSVSATIASILKELESVLDESCPQSFQRPFVTHDSEAKAEFVNQPSPRVPFPAAQTQSNCVDTRKEEMFNTNSPNPLGSSREIELIRELVLAAACSVSSTDTLSEVPGAMDASALEPVPIEATPCPNGEAPVDMDTSNPEKLDNSALTVPAEELRPSDAVFGSFEIMNSSYLNDVSLDDPFSDIDTSVFEKESQSVGSSSSSSSRLSASEELWFPSSCNSPSYSSSQGMRETNELDNIIEILVGS